MENVHPPQQRVSLRKMPLIPLQVRITSQLLRCSRVIFSNTRRDGRSKIIPIDRYRVKENHADPCEIFRPSVLWTIGIRYCDWMSNHGSDREVYP
ncbi:hypothetical protein BH24CHL1_BH24CHL1_08500 [soil metagenome]